jgi:hypothetical protein
LFSGLDEDTLSAATNTKEPEGLHWDTCKKKKKKGRTMERKHVQGSELHCLSQADWHFVGLGRLQPIDIVSNAIFSE